MHFLYHFRNPAGVFYAIKAAFGGKLGPVFWYERYLVGPGFKSDLHYRLGKAHFKVKLACHSFLEQTDIAVVNVPAILAEVYGYAVGFG